MTHCSPASEPPISRWMAGNATLTIVTSSWITKKPRQTEIRAAPLRCPGASGRASGSCCTARSILVCLPADVQTRVEPWGSDRGAPDVQAALRDVVAARAVDQADQPVLLVEGGVQGRGPGDLALTAGLQPHIFGPGEL